MKKDKNVIKALALVSQLGISMMVPILLCIFIGYQLDKHFQTKFWFILFMVLGVLSAFRNVYYMTKQFYAKDKAREDAELKYIEDLKREAHKVANGNSKKKL